MTPYCSKKPDTRVRKKETVTEAWLSLVAQAQEPTQIMRNKNACTRITDMVLVNALSLSVFVGLVLALMLTSLVDTKLVYTDTIYGPTCQTT